MVQAGAAIMSEKLPDLPLLIYDSECTLCVRFTQALKRLPGTSDINTVSIHEEKIYEEYPALKKEECHQVVHLILQDGKIIAGPEVLEYLVEQFPGVSKFSWLIESNMGKKTIDYFHKVANKCRQSLIKRCSTCNNSNL